MAMMLYQQLATLVSARKNCEATKNLGWFDKHSAEIYRLVKEHMPSGSGFDDDTCIDLANSNHNKLVFDASFHHMNDVGMYDGWTMHKIIVRPNLVLGFELSISGRDHNQIKDYIHEMFYTALRTEYAYWA